MDASPAHPGPSPLRRALAALVVKDRVALGALGEAQRDLALGLAAAVVAEGGVFSEPQVNAALKQALAAHAAFLATDHVELRRWLVDRGWWRRDGFGRAYERVAAAELPPALRPVREALDALDLPAFVAAARERARAERDARRTAWRARAAGA